MKKKISLIDILIILVIALCLVFVVKYFSTNSKKAYNVPEVSYVVELKSLDEKNLDVFKVGDKIIDGVKGGYLGNVTKVEIKDNVETREDTENGRFIQSSFENRKDVYLTISGVPTTYTDDEILFATQEIKIGKQLHMKSKNYVGHGYIISVIDEK
ncbi:MAG: DUF4330 domain-containing protein [Clostridia bacterium]|nr:DUF4330 domain-containing protein [Oscillospiraceae bacterium]MDY5627516.1 DUF4330 domain-containing protein [Clostridia bacterium]